MTNDPKASGNSTPSSQRPAQAPVTKPPSAELITNQFSGKDLVQRSPKK